MFSFVNAAISLACLISSISAVAVPPQPLGPRALSEEDDGIFQGYKRENDHDNSCSHGPESRGCWSDGFNIDTDMDLKWPNTGKTVKYHLEITNGTGSPDGFERPMMLINGQYPGPTIVADWGDDLEITVSSKLRTNGTGMHWHGIRQLGSNQEDGVNGITECPIVPGQSRTYRFKATQFGTSWYHSHYSVQYADGLVGPIVINGPSTANYDIDLGVLPISDWFHTSAFTVNAASLHAFGPPTADNVLVNGSMTSAVGGKYAETTLTPGKSHLLRLINTGINNYLHVALDGHPFTVISADFTPIVPFEATSLVLAVGQRYEVIINATEDIGNYWLRVGTGGRCDGPNANAGNIKSIFRYAGAGYGQPDSIAAAPLPVGCDDEQNIIPWVPTTVPQDTPQELVTGFDDNYTDVTHSNGVVQWLINGIPMAVDLDYPTLQSVIDDNDNFTSPRHVFEIDGENNWQYWVIQQDAAAPALPHPIHLHGHDFYILDSQANAQWSGDTSRLRTKNPIRRDTASLPASGYLVLAFESDNPGAWLMHCHIPFHIAAGLGVQFLERKSEIPALLGSLRGMQEGCGKWREFHGEFYPNGILIHGDSGL